MGGKEAPLWGSRAPRLERKATAAAHATCTLLLERGQSSGVCIVPPSSVGKQQVPALRPAPGDRVGCSGKRVASTFMQRHPGWQSECRGHACGIHSVHSPLYHGEQGKASESDHVVGHSSVALPGRTALSPVT